MYRVWVSCHWRWWRQYWWGHSWCCMRVTLRVMTTAVHRWLAGPDVPRDERLLCCHQCAGTGDRLWVAGRSHRLVGGSDINWRSTLNVSTTYCLVAWLKKVKVKECASYLWKSISQLRSVTCRMGSHSGAFLHKDTANCDTFTKIGRNEGHTMLINLRPCSGASRRFRPSVKNSTKSNVLSN